MKSFKNIIIIPARGGSKRLLGKNLRVLVNKPLLEHTIDYAQANKTGESRIIVSTDDDRISDFAESKNIDVQRRPDHLSGDDVPTVDVLKYVIENLEQEFDNVILLQVTNPLRPKNMFKNAYNTFVNGNYSSLMTVTRNHQKFGKIINNEFVPFNYEMGQRSQDLEPLYFENGLMYITKSSLIKQGEILGKNNCPFIVDHPFAQVDIDTKEDMDLAEYLASKKELKEELR